MAVTNDGSVVLVNCECDITGDDLDLHENCWVADCVPVEILVLLDGAEVAGVNVTATATGAQGNLTWVQSAMTDSQGTVHIPVALLVRNGEYWYNLSSYTFEAAYGEDSSTVTENITKATGIIIELNAGDDNGNDGNGDPVDVGGEDGGDDDDYFVPVIVMIAVLVVVAVIVRVHSRLRRGRAADYMDDSQGETAGDADKEWEGESEKVGEEGNVDMEEEEYYWEPE